MHSAARWIALVGVASIILACGGDSITPTAPDIVGLDGALTTEKKPPGKGKPSDEIPLIVTFDPGAVMGDGAGPYAHDPPGVEAFIRSNGNFWLSVQEDMSRQLCLNFTTGVQTGANGPPFVADCVDGRIGMSNPSIGLPEMENPSTTDAQVTVVWVTTDFRWSLSFGGGCGASDGSGNRVTITRLDDTWTISGGNAILCADERGRKGRIIRTEEWTGDMHFSLKASVQNPQ